MGIITKVITWIRMNGATLLGLIQLGIKGVKEVLTGLVNVISIFLPASKAEMIILNVRSLLEKVDGVIEIIKQKLLAMVI